MNAKRVWTVREYAQAIGIDASILAKFPAHVLIIPVQEKKMARALGRYTERGMRGVVLERSVTMHPGLRIYPAALRRVFLHEVAHAAAGVDAAHGPKWRAWCAVFGIPDETPICRDTAAVDAFLAYNRAAAPWRWKCGASGAHGVLHRRSPSRTYRHCGADVAIERNAR